MPGHIYPSRSPREKKQGFSGLCGPAQRATSNVFLTVLHLIHLPVLYTLYTYLSLFYTPMSEPGQHCPAQKAIP